MLIPTRSTEKSGSYDDNQQDIPILAPVIQREIIYRLLVGD
jgi:hypothetical protein